MRQSWCEVGFKFSLELVSALLLNAASPHCGNYENLAGHWWRDEWISGDCVEGGWTKNRFTVKSQAQASDPSLILALSLVLPKNLKARRIRLPLPPHPVLVTQVWGFEWTACRTFLKRSCWCKWVSDKSSLPVTGWLKSSRRLRWVGLPPLSCSAYCLVTPHLSKLFLSQSRKQANSQVWKGNMVYVHSSNSSPESRFDQVPALVRPLLGHTLKLLFCTQKNEVMV